MTDPHAPRTTGPTDAATSAAVLATAPLHDQRPLRSRWAALIAAGVAAVLLGRSAVQIASLPGALAYTIDDSHIHLRIAQLLVEGTYGINPGEAASPSSSPLWPFLLAPFGRTPALEWMPMAVNATAALISTYVVCRILEIGWTARHVAARSLCAIAAVALMLGSGALALVFEGMEHSLHALLGLLVAYGLVLLARQPHRPGPWWLWASIAALPLVRYEGLVAAVVAVIVAHLLGAGRVARRAAAAGVAGLVLFSGFLMVLGLSPLPSSVTAKARPASVSTVEYVLDNLGRAFTGSGNAMVAPIWVALAVIVMAALVTSLRRASLRDHATLLAGAAALVMLTQMAIAPERRYVGHALLLLMVVLTAVAIPRLRNVAAKPVVAAVLVLAVAATLVGVERYRGVLSGAALRARAIHDQQHQLHRLATQELNEPVGVNDIGHVAFDNPNRVIDLWGLADEGARKARISGEPNWPAALLDARGAEIAMVYSSWFGDDLPEEWILVGTLTNPNWVLGPAEPTVDFYASNPSAATRLRAALESFEPSDPERTEITVTVASG